jgi:hypothetical protein
MESAGIPSLAAWIRPPNSHEIIGLLILAADHGAVFETETKGILIHDKAPHVSPEEPPDRLEVALMFPDIVDFIDCTVSLNNFCIATDGNLDGVKIEQNPPCIPGLFNAIY